MADLPPEDQLELELELLPDEPLDEPLEEPLDLLSERESVR